MYESRPRDWSRWERVSRVWARKLERDMRAMGDEIEREMSGLGRTRRGAWCGPGSAWVFDWDDRWERRRQARAARRRARASRRAARCRGWSFGWCWWLAFPLFFVGVGMFEDAGGWPGVSAGIEGLLAGSLNLTLAAPVAQLVASAVGVSFLEGYGLLALAGALAGAAALIGLKAGRPRAR